MLAVDCEGCVGVLAREHFGAAHSMDTDWYAVDKHGDIARCFSNEQAVFPSEGFLDYEFTMMRSLAIAQLMAAGPPSPWMSADALARAQLSDPAERALVQAIVAGDEASREIYRDWLHLNRPTTPTLYRVERHIAPIRYGDLADKWNGVIQFVTPEEAQRFLEAFGSAMTTCERLGSHYGWPDAIAGTDLDNWMVAGDLAELGIVAAYELTVERESCARIGIYSYDAEWAGPYYRNQVPSEPLTIDQIPEPLRSEIERCRLPIAFRTTEVFSPDSFVDCRSYGE